MMLHRHFEVERKHENITTLADMTPNEEEFVSEIFPPEEDEAPKRRVGRPRKQQAE